MPKRNCPNHSPMGFSVPGPLYSRGDRRGETAELTAGPVEIIRTAAAAVVEEPQMCRHPHPIPVTNSGLECETVCLLRQQNELLCEILAAVNALTATRLSQRDGAG